MSLPIEDSFVTVDLHVALPYSLVDRILSTCAACDRFTDLVAAAAPGALLSPEELTEHQVRVTESMVDVFDDIADLVEEAVARTSATTA